MPSLASAFLTPKKHYPHATRCVRLPAWSTLLRARAVETQSYVVAAAQVGEHWVGGRRSYGHSLVIAPDGTILADGGGYEKDSKGDVDESLKDFNLYVDLDIDDVVKEREEVLQVGRHGREDVCDSVVIN